jgi:hypothetical protein
MPWQKASLDGLLLRRCKTLPSGSEALHAGHGALRPAEVQAMVSCCTLIKEIITKDLASQIKIRSF